MYESGFNFLRGVCEAWSPLKMGITTLYTLVEGGITRILFCHVQTPTYLTVARFVIDGCKWKVGEGGVDHRSKP